MMVFSNIVFLIISYVSHFNGLHSSKIIKHYKFFQNTVFGHFLSLAGCFFFYCHKGTGRAFAYVLLSSSPAHNCSRLSLTSSEDRKSNKSEEDVLQYLSEGYNHVKLSAGGCSHKT